MTARTRLLRFWVGLFFFCLGLLTAGAQSQPFKFAWLSDTHVGSANAAEDLQATVQEINETPGLSFVIVSGDVTEYGTRDQLKQAKQILDGLKIPSYVIPGNHDTKWSESGATDFSRIWEADRFKFEHNGVLFVGLHQGPLMKMGDGHWAPQDVRWLRETLQGLDKNRPMIFVTHYPIDPGIANWYVVLDLLRDYNVQAVLCGHGHGNRAMNFEGIPGVMGRSNLRAQKDVGGYNIVEVQNAKLTFTERNPGRAAKPQPWHSLEATARKSPVQTNAFERPNYAVNSQYPAVRPKWIHDTGYTIASTPAVAEGLAIVGDASGSIYGMSLKDGKAAWTNRTGGAIYSTPAVSGKLAVVASTDGSVYALDPAKGNTVWRYRTDRPIVASPAIGDGKVFVGSSEGKFRALDLASGKQVWEFSGLGNYVETRPLLHEGKVIFGAWDQHLYALDAGSGKLVWKWKGDKAGALLSPAACWPVAAHDKVFIVAPDRKMTAIHAGTGAQVWRTGDYVVRESIGLSTDAEKIYVRAMNDFVYAFATGPDSVQKVWECNAAFGYDINSAMLVEKHGIVFYGTKNGLLFAFDAASGAVSWKHKLGPGIVNTVVPLSARQVLATDFDGRVFLVENTAVASKAN